MICCFGSVAHAELNDLKGDLGLLGQHITKNLVLMILAQA